MRKSTALYIYIYIYIYIYTHTHIYIKRQYISKGGRVTLTPPPYLFHVAFPDLESGVQKARKIKRDFLWGGGEPGKEASFGELGHGMYR